MDKSRRFEIDLIKAVAILGVVFIHSISRLWSANDPMSTFLGDFTRFAVPGFVFSAGFLFKKDKIKAGPLSLRLMSRVLPPYVFCSLVFALLGLSDTPKAPGLSDLSKIVYDLIFCNTIGIYYFIFVISYLYALSFILRLLSSTIIVFVWALVAVITVLFYLQPLYFLPAPIIATLPKGYDGFFFVLMRHPCVHLFFYISGWVVQLYFDRIKTLFRKQFFVLFSLAVLADLAAVFVIYKNVDTYSLKQLAIQVHIIFTIMYLLLLGIKYQFLPKTVYYLSYNSYAMFLVHLPFVRGFQSLFPDMTVRFSFLYSTLAWVVGVIGSIILIFIIKKIFRSYSIYAVGA